VTEMIRHEGWYAVAVIVIIVVALVLFL